MVNSDLAGGFVNDCEAVAFSDRLAENYAKWAKMLLSIEQLLAKRYGLFKFIGKQSLASLLRISQSTVKFF